MKRELAFPDAALLYESVALPCQTKNNNLKIEKQRYGLAFIVAIFLAMSALQMHAQVVPNNSAQSNVHPRRPAGVPSEFIATPNGYFHPSCVEELRKGDVVLRDEGNIRHADGTYDVIPRCNYPHYTARGRKIDSQRLMDGGTKTPPEIDHDYPAYASLTTSTSYAGVIGSMTVPPAPTSNDGQILYFYPGLQDYEVEPPEGTIIQPVLGWNAFSNHTKWSIASWNCCYDGTEVYSTPMSVSSGDLIIGEVYSNCSDTETCPTWYVSTEDAGKGSTTLTDTSSYSQTFNWGFGAAMEVYSVAQCSDYPSNGSITISGAIYAQDGDPIDDPAWTLSANDSLSPDCGYNVTSTSEGEELTITY